MEEARKFGFETRQPVRWTMIKTQPAMHTAQQIRVFRRIGNRKAADLNILCSNHKSLPVRLFDTFSFDNVCQS